MPCFGGIATPTAFRRPSTNPPHAPLDVTSEPRRRLDAPETCTIFIVANPAEPVDLVKQLVGVVGKESEETVMPLTCTYNNSTGRLVCTNASGTTVVDQTGYSGTGAGRNNPDMANVPNVGPIPEGGYTVGTGHAGGHTGPQTLNVDADAGTNTHGRDAFRIHGDNARHDASEGCIIMPRNVRDTISNAGGAHLTVTR